MCGETHIPRDMCAGNTLPGETYITVTTPKTEQETEPFPGDSILIVQGQSKPIVVTLELNSKSVDMEVDTGAAVSLMSEATQKKLFPQAKLQKTTLRLQTYTAETLSVLGTLEVLVNYGNYTGKHTLVVVDGNGPTLFGRDWLIDIRLDWTSLGVANVKQQPLTLQGLLTTYSDVFNEELGTLTGFKVKLIKSKAE